MATLGLREQHKRDRKEAIYQSAIRLFSEQGYAETTVLDIAHAAGVSRGTVFNYYAYKEAILLEYFYQDFSALERFTQTDTPPLEAFWHVVDAVADIVEAKRTWMIHAAQELMHPEPERSQYALEALPVNKFFDILLQRAQAKAQVRNDFSAQRLARILTNIYFITALQWGIYRIDRPLKEELRKALTIAIEGIGHS